MSGKQVSNNYAPCFNRINFVVIPSYIELPWYQGCTTSYKFRQWDEKENWRNAFSFVVQHLNTKDAILHLYNTITVWITNISTC